jgi:hypothetical protein
MHQIDKAQQRYKHYLNITNNTQTAMECVISEAKEIIDSHERSSSKNHYVIKYWRRVIEEYKNI